MTAKQHLRREMRRKSPVSNSKSTAVTSAVSRWLDARPEHRHIALYSALPGEADPSTLTATHADRYWYFPRCDGENLSFHRVENPHSDLLPGAYGILEPSPALPAVDLEIIDVFLCPGLAFDPRGGRLGRGRGYYDRVLSRSRADALKIGVCLPHQLVPDTFTEPHDILMDLVISGG
jgi:5-formyltetrahydrofolate cyclo-ligase